MEDTLDIALEHTLDKESTALKNTLGIALEYTLDLGHRVLATLKHTYCVEKLRPALEHTLNIAFIRWI